jgi:PRC-barrel domain
MPDMDTVRTWEGRTMLDRDGSRIGSIEAIYLDDQTGEPEWALVNTGLFGTKSSFVPLAQATQAGEEVRVPTTSSWSRTPPGSTPTSTCRRPRSGSCGATTASTTTGPPVPGWDGTPRRGRPMRP